LVACRGHTPHPIVRFLVLLAAFATFGSPALAQGVGFQGGFTIDPEQVYVGSHLETREIASAVSIRAGIEGGFGSDLTLAAITVDFLYKYSLGGAWKIYQGGGPAIYIFRAGTPAQTDVTGGLTAIFGFAHDNGFFSELRVGSHRGPVLKFGVGFTVR